MHSRKTWKQLSKQYGLSASAIGRHKHHRIASASIVKPPSSAMLERTQHAVANMMAGGEIVAEIRALKKRADSLGASAEASGDVRTALLAIRELTRLVELQGRLTLEAQQGRASDVANHPVFHEVTACIMQALEAYPDARRSVNDAIARRLGLVVPVEVQGESLPYPTGGLPSPPSPR